MTNYDFAIKHRKAFIVYCEAIKKCPNPHDSKLAREFRQAVEKQLKSIRAGQVQAKPSTYALIGPDAGTVEHKGPKAKGVYESHEIPAKHRAFVVDDSGFCVM